MSKIIRFDGTFFRGRVALYAALKALGIGPGDEVALQAYTCIAVPEGIMATGAMPRYIDIERGGVNMSARELEESLDDKIKAIVVQHTFGYPAQMDKIMDIARARNLPVIEDCAHSYWSQYGNQRVGTFGDAAVYSLEWAKPLVVGVGGGLVINNECLREKVDGIHRQMSLPASARDTRMQLQYVAYKVLYSPARFWFVKKLYGLLSRGGVAEQSFNELGTEISTDFTLRLLPSVERRLQKKLPLFRPDWQHNNEVIDAYRDALVNTHFVAGIPTPEGTRTMFARLPLWVDDKQLMLAAARKVGYELADWFESPVDPLTNKNYHVVGYEVGMCPNAEASAAHIVSLPCNRLVRPAAAKRAMNAMLKAYGQKGSGGHS
jgi:dTDP-4-amino-4,6-dideoxygalactose transaminase